MSVTLQLKHLLYSVMLTEGVDKGKVYTQLTDDYNNSSVMRNNVSYCLNAINSYLSDTNGHDYDLAIDQLMSKVDPYTVKRDMTLVGNSKRTKKMVGHHFYVSLFKTHEDQVSYLFSQSNKND